MCSDYPSQASSVKKENLEITVIAGVLVRFCMIARLKIRLFSEKVVPITNRQAPQLTPEAYTAHESQKLRSPYSLSGINNSVQIIARKGKWIQAVTRRSN